MTIETAPYGQVLNMCELPCALRRVTALKAFEALVPGRSFEIVNDCDPSRLRKLFSSRSLEPFDWTYLEEGPSVWRVRVSLP
ncbi:DUF2249 domain-containing protein [Roseibium suaedae]|uniref:Uncharacterized conserved protein n=1 Tax=Roseibium suaedae TaxID=735517 RepID=A0A1M7NX89_9HYPH|nr:DUF2249 domain-containing protein [Roseibium suaedae]SHN08726.1 Uncharacterized conserved protein [Roseibium suaedae]